MQPSEWITCFLAKAICGSQTVEATEEVLHSIREYLQFYSFLTRAAKLRPAWEHQRRMWAALVAGKPPAVQCACSHINSMSCLAPKPVSCYV